jgi:hypothetical protein
VRVPEKVMLLKGFKDGGHRSQRLECRNKEGRRGERRDLGFIHY